MLGPLELIPLVSWLAQKGRCRHCGAELSGSLFWREAACGALFVLVARMPGSPAVLAVRLLCLSLMLVVSWLDMDELQLYEDFFPPLGLLFLILHGLTDGDFLGPVAGAAILWALLALIHWQVPEGMGAGDPKLAAVMGLWLGPVLGLRSFFLAMGMAFLSVAFLGFKTHSRWQEHMAMQVPLAPFFFGAGLLLRSRALLGPVDTGGMPELFCFLGILELDRTKGRYWLSRAGGVDQTASGSLARASAGRPGRRQDGDPGPGTKEERRLGSGAVPGTGLAGTDLPGFFPGPGRRSGPVAPGSLCQTGADRFLRAVDPEP